MIIKLNPHLFKLEDGRESESRLCCLYLIESDPIFIGVVKPADFIGMLRRKHLITTQKHFNHPFDTTKQKKNEKKKY